MTAQRALIQDIEASLRGDPDRRAETLERVADLFICTGSRLTEEQIELFDDVLVRLAGAADPNALEGVSGRFAPLVYAPRGLVLMLARHDEITVAGPVLRISPRLGDADLASIARSRGAPHLVAISTRPNVGEIVTDVLVRRGDHEVVRAIVTNRAAHFSEAGFAALMQRAAHDDILAVQLGRRPDIPGPILQRLVAHASPAVQARLISTVHPRLQSDVQRAFRSGGEPRGGRRDYAAANESVAALSQAGGLSEAALYRAAGAGQAEETVVMLSVLCRVPLDIVDRLYMARRPDPIVMLCKAADFEWRTAAAVLTLCRGDDGRGYEDARTRFNTLPVATAQRVLNFWRGRPVAGTG